MMRESLLLVATFAGCGGNYSNEDIDFQLALPAQEDLAARMPHTVEVLDAAEYYKVTRDVVASFNTVAGAFLSLIDAVRLYPPTERQPGHRVWGPVPHDKHPGWQVRVVIDREPGSSVPATFHYSVDVRPTAPAASWIPLIIGAVRSDGGVRRGDGEMTFTSTAARAAGYPLDTLEGWESLTVEHRTGSFPISIKMTLVDHPAGARTVYSYQEQTDGSGSMVFDFPTPKLAPIARLVRIQSRWLPSLAGRSDMQVIDGLRAGAGGVDCWGSDTRPTYVERDLEPARNMGLASSCLLPAP
jgi:hypothetical protein